MPIHYLKIETEKLCHYNELILNPPTHKQFITVLLGMTFMGGFLAQVKVISIAELCNLTILQKN